MLCTCEQLAEKLRCAPRRPDAETPPLLHMWAPQAKLLDSEPAAYPAGATAQEQAGSSKAPTPRSGNVSDAVRWEPPPSVVDSFLGFPVGGVFVVSLELVVFYVKLLVAAILPTGPLATANSYMRAAATLMFVSLSLTQFIEYRPVAAGPRFWRNTAKYSHHAMVVITVAMAFASGTCSPSYEFLNVMEWFFILAVVSFIFSRALMFVAGVFFFDMLALPDTGGHAETGALAVNPDSTSAHDADDE